MAFWLRHQHVIIPGKKKSFRRGEEMQYRKNKYGEPISVLGFGCMRFARKGTGIDLEEAEREILHAVELGVNYFDTAYVYPGSEAALGKILSRNPIRDKINIATKLPQYLVKTRAAVDRYFNEELSRLQMDHVDYYLMHMLTDISEWERLKKLGIEEWITRKKESGQIRNIGFSFHGNTEMFLKILDAYDWDFCQIQYNYMDENTQAGRTGLQAAAAKGIPVIIMEPLRGGRLIHMLPEKAKKAVAADPGKRSAAELGLSWLWNQPEVTCVLSGMNSMEMVEENCRIASRVHPGSLSGQDQKLIGQIRDSINEKLRVNCTGCRYCMPCPQGVDIPGAFRCYNAMYMESKSTGRHEYFQTVALRREPAFPSQCIGCGKCEKHCPQQIPIRQELKNAGKALLPPYYRAAVAIARKVTV